MTKHLSNLLLAVASPIVFLVLAELILQVTVPLIKPRFTRLDPVMGWYHTPGVKGKGEVEGHSYRISYNSHGFRAPERTLERRDGHRRVLMLGDSFVDGSEVGDHELFTFHLENRLPRTEVINLGVYGYQTAQEYVTLRDRGLRFSPDLAVLMVVSNDLPGNVVALESFGSAPRFVLYGDSLRFEGLDHASAREAFRAANIPVPAWIHQHSLVYYILNYYLYQRMAAARIQAFREQRLAEVSTADQAELLRRIIARMQRLCDEQGVPFVVVLSYLRYELEQLEHSPLAEVAAMVRDDGTDVIDLFDDLRTAQISSDSSLYYRRDIHWNTRGHRVIADLLEPVVRHRLEHPPARVRVEPKRAHR